MEFGVYLFRGMCVLLALVGLIGFVPWRSLPELRGPTRGATPLVVASLLLGWLMISRSLHQTMVMPLQGDEVDTFAGLAWHTLPWMVLGDSGIPGVLYTAVAGSLWLLADLAGVRTLHLLLILGHAAAVLALCHRLGFGVLGLLAGVTFLTSDPLLHAMHALRPHALANLCMLWALVLVCGPPSRRELGLAALLVGLAGLDNPLFALCLPVVLWWSAPLDAVDGPRPRRVLFASIYAGGLFGLAVMAVDARPAGTAELDSPAVLTLWIAAVMIGLSASRLVIAGRRALLLVAPLVPALAVLFLLGSLETDLRYTLLVELPAWLAPAATLDRALPAIPARAAALWAVLIGLLSAPNDPADNLRMWKRDARAMVHAVEQLETPPDQIFLVPPLRVVELGLILDHGIPPDSTESLALQDGLEVFDISHLADKEPADWVTLMLVRPVHVDAVEPPDSCEVWIEREEGWVARCSEDVLTLWR